MNLAKEATEKNQKSSEETATISYELVHSNNEPIALKGLHFQKDLERNNRVFKFIYNLELSFMNCLSSFKSSNNPLFIRIKKLFALNKLERNISIASNRAEKIREQILTLHHYYAELQLAMEELERDVLNIKKELSKEN